MSTNDTVRYSTGTGMIYVNDFKVRTYGTCTNMIAFPNVQKTAQFKCLFRKK